VKWALSAALGGGCTFLEQRLKDVVAIVLGAATWKEKSRSESLFILWLVRRLARLGMAGLVNDVAGGRGS
jgi:hypothetical protein